MDIQGETWPGSLRQITMQKQESINSIWWEVSSLFLYGTASQAKHKLAGQ